MDNFDQDEFNEDFDFGDDDYGAWPSSKGPGGPPMPRRFGPPNNDRYNNAYGNYRGGYGPGGGFGPPMGPPGPPRPPPGPLVMFGRGFGPGGPPSMGGPPGPPMQRNAPPEVRAFRYQLRCGVAREVLKNLPKQMLLIMEPEYCGVCAMEFDSFVMSRMHYTSRNHAKNQKKWISQNSEYGSGGSVNKEIPLKSRDLYCELCDVHITSKTHAESHYAGKPHRAIVEGRKKAKNPYLLQKGMEYRIEQLIRREKKHIKPVDKMVEEESLKDVKPFQPELYCDICKTSVTCTEQMTMHLNGKKHLAKEKQHIIRVMNGQVKKEEDDADGAETYDDQTGDAVETSGAQTGDNVAEASGTKQENMEDGDWGNGSGTWEES